MYKGYSRYNKTFQNMNFIGEYWNDLWKRKWRIIKGYFCIFYNGQVIKILSIHIYEKMIKTFHSHHRCNSISFKKYLGQFHPERVLEIIVRLEDLLHCCSLEMFRRSSISMRIWLGGISKLLQTSAMPYVPVYKRKWFIPDQCWIWNDIFST